MASPSATTESVGRLVEMIHTRGHNLKLILPHCSKDVYKHSFWPVTLQGWNALPQAAVHHSAKLVPVQGKSPRCYELTHQAVSILH